MKPSAEDLAALAAIGSVWPAVSLIVSTLDKAGLLDANRVFDVLHSAAGEMQDRDAQKAADVYRLFAEYLERDLEGGDPKAPFNVGR